MNIRRWGLIASLAFVIVMASGASPVFGEEGGDNTIPGRYIVVFKDHVGNPGASAREHARKHRFELTHIYKKALKGFSARLSSRTLKILSADPSVALVEPDRQVWALPQPLSTGVDRIDADLNATAAIDGGGNPLNVNVAIIDTGVDLDHEDLRVRPAGEGFASYALILGSSISCGFYQDTPDDGHGHGSHVAGIVGALDNNIGVVGVAPGALITPVRVLAGGSGCLSDVIAGIEFVTSTRTDSNPDNDVHVANMSLAWQGNSTGARTAIQNSVASGVVYVVAAANSEQDIFGADGLFGTNDDFEPAAYPEVATISAMADFDGVPGGLDTTTSYSFSACIEAKDDSFACFSNYSNSDHTGANKVVNSSGGAIDLMLPGVGIDSTYRNNGYATMSGTSMASPHAAGLVALYIAQNAPANNAAEVYAIRQDLIDQGMDQASGKRLTTLDDPDGNPEPLGWAGATAPAPILTSILAQVAAGSDDAYHIPAGWPGYSDSKSAVYAGALGSGPAWGGWRWTSLGIPAGATITEAYVELNQSGWGYNITTTLAFEDSPNPATFSGASTPYDRWASHTTIEVDWAWPKKAPGTWIQTPSLVAIIQELVDTPTAPSTP